MDEIIRAVSKDGFVKISVVTARDAVQRANAIHHCSPTAIAALGRSLCAASMLGDLLKEENGTLTLRISGGGGLGTIIAVSDSDGNVRGMVSNPAFDLPTRPDGKLDVGGAVGKDGMFTVSRDIGLREPYVGSTELVSGEIAEDLSAYLVETRLSAVEPDATEEPEVLAEGEPAEAMLWPTLIGSSGKSHILNCYSNK